MPQSTCNLLQRLFLFIYNPSKWVSASSLFIDKDSYILFLYLPIIFIFASQYCFLPTFLAVYLNSSKTLECVIQFSFYLPPQLPPKTWHSSLKKKFSICISQFYDFYFMLMTPNLFLMVTAQTETLYYPDDFQNSPHENSFGSLK